MMNARFDIHSASSYEGDGRTNEDFLGWTETAAWVLDGATGVSRETLPYSSDAHWFVRTFSESLHRNLIMNPSAAAVDVLNQSIATTRERYEEITGSDTSTAQGLPSAAFVMIRILDKGLEITSLGDCKALFQDDEGVVQTFYDPSLEPFENRTLSALQSLRRQCPDSMQHELIDKLKPTIRENRKLMNKPGGYRVLSLANIDEESFETKTISLQADSLIVLASDGFLRYVEVFEQCDYEVLYRKLWDDHPGSIVKSIRELESEDPDCSTYLRVKKSDDATCLVVKTTSC